jgi:hypothetical protein
MRFSKMLTVLRAIRVSSLMAAMLAASSGCATNVPPSDEQEIAKTEQGKTGQGGEKAPAITKDLHDKANLMLDVSGGTSEESGGYPYCDQGEVFVGVGREVLEGTNAACADARSDAVSQCEATQCYDRNERKVRSFDCDSGSCRTWSTWYGWYAEYTMEGD